MRGEPVGKLFESLRGEPPICRRRLRYKSSRCQEESHGSPPLQSSDDPTSSVELQIVIGSPLSLRMALRHALSDAKLTIWSGFPLGVKIRRMLARLTCSGRRRV